jgi:hypothetical protein
VSTSELERVPSFGKVDPHGYVFHRDFDQPELVQGRERSLVRSYDVRVAEMGGVATTVIYVISGSVGIPIPRETPTWWTWLPEIDARVYGKNAGPRSTVAHQVEEIQRITGLSDGELAAACPGGVARETVNRWRNRPNPNLREENLYRLGLIFELAQRMEEAGIEAPVWLHQASHDGEMPYALICQGRLADVRRAVEAIAAGVASPVEPMAAIPSHREHDVVIEEEDEGDWSWSEPDGDTGE